MKKVFIINICVLAYVFTFRVQAQLSVPNVVIDSQIEGTECAIIINRQSPLHLLAAFNPGYSGGSLVVDQEFMYRSSDGGLSWMPVPINNYFSFNYASWDPAFASDNTGRFYFQMSDSTYKMHSFVSTDFGATWNTETIIHDADKECIKTDNIPTSSYQENLYSAYTRVNNVGTKSYLLLTHSSNHGLSWSQPADTLDFDLGGGFYCPTTGSSIAIGPSGEVNVSWAGGTPNQIHFKKSVDGATTWPNTPTIIDPNVMPQNHFLEYPIGITVLEGAWTSLACDVSGGPNNGNLYCVWSDFRNTHSDIYMGRSTDGGLNWNTQRINDDLTNNDQLHPTVAVDPVTGWVYVAFMDARDDKTIPRDTAYYYLAYSNDGGVNFQNVKVSQKPSTVIMEDDYYGMDAYDGKVQLIWASSEGSFTNDSSKIMTATVTQAALEPTLVNHQQKSSDIIFYPPYPNPSIDLITFDFKLPETTSLTLTISDMKGNVVASLVKDQIYSQGTHRFEFSNNMLSEGMYVVSIITPNHKVYRELSVVK